MVHLPGSLYTHKLRWQSNGDPTITAPGKEGLQQAITDLTPITMPPKQALGWKFLIAVLALSSAALHAVAEQPTRWVVQCKPAKCAALQAVLKERGFMVKESGKNFLAVVRDPASARWAKEAALSVEASFGDLSAFGEHASPITVAHAHLIL